MKRHLMNAYWVFTDALLNIYSQSLAVYDIWRMDREDDD